LIEALLALEASLALLFGLTIGSFLNVCVYRWPRDLSVVRPRSHCTSCDKMIAGYDNVPVFSFLLLRGRCRHCKARIPVRYPIVELLTGALFFYFVYTLGPTVAALKMCVLAALLVGLTFADLEERILPDEFTKGGLALGFVFALFVTVPDTFGQSILWLLGVDVTGRAASVTEAVFGSALPAFFLWSAGAIYFRIRHKEGLGFGDVKLIAMVGSFLGLTGALWTLIAGGVAGSILGSIYVKATGKEFGTYELPFGSFLGIAALALAVWHKGVS
jgi:leader peptidase (prepilin peptidase)/N-methyltransferase